MIQTRLKISLTLCVLVLAALVWVVVADATATMQGPRDDTPTTEAPQPKGPAKQIPWQG